MMDNAYFHKFDVLCPISLPPESAIVSQLDQVSSSLLVHIPCTDENDIVVPLDLAMSLLSSLSLLWVAAQKKKMGERYSGVLIQLDRHVK
jgi:hypothetical protein